jgi:LPXTG-motif cell wall-anchored protein
VDRPTTGCAKGNMKIVVVGASGVVISVLLIGKKNLGLTLASCTGRVVPFR